MIESQSRYVVDAINPRRLPDGTAAGARTSGPGVQERFQEEIQRKLVNGVWTPGWLQELVTLDAKGVKPDDPGPGFNLAVTGWRPGRSTRPTTS